MKNQSSWLSEYGWNIISYADVNNFSGAGVGLAVGVDFGIYNSRESI